MTRRSFVFSATVAAAMAAPPRSQMGLATTSFMTFRKPRVTLEFLEYAHSLGAGGIQCALSTVEPEYECTSRAASGASPMNHVACIAAGARRCARR